ncbi:nicotinamide N-methyltransferase-like [Hippopotamus amphibius kiboko]|uniref:nicotinamide N-methyltransferase-like n=1 Tax=Hippopotamus amphibius kiboko TaxID=575201 RepID=UPI0025970FEF|nr:nicotinamide N-methyltransferase-like [Hippopotamus amphibius kiboko]
MALQQSKEPDVYQENFEPASYLDYYKMNQDPMADEILHFMLKHYSATFKPGGLEGKLLIDIGSGPTIYQLLSACESFQEIVATDYTDKNRQELEKWLKKMPGAFDWSPGVKYVCELEGNRDRWAEKEERLRRAVRQVLKCDILKERPLEPVALLPADCLISSLCLEAACPTLQACRDALRHLRSLLRPRGHLVLSGAFETSFYMVGDKRFSALPLDEKFLREALQENGFIIEKLEKVPRVPKTCLDNRSDYTGLFFLVARRKD